MCLRRTATGSKVVAESAALETGTVPSSATSPTEGGKAPTRAPAGEQPSEPSMTAEPGEIPGRSAAGFEIVEEFEDASVTKKPIGKRSLAYTVCDRARGHPKSPPGPRQHWPPGPEKECFVWRVPRTARQISHSGGTSEPNDRRDDRPPSRRRSTRNRPQVATSNTVCTRLG